MSRLMLLWDTYGLEEGSKSCEEAGVEGTSKLQVALGNALLVQRDGVPIPIPSLSGLYLGSLGAAYNIDALKSAGITHILCLSAAVRCKFPDQFNYLRLAFDDKPDAPLSDIISQACNFIDNSISSGVLVHCYQGVS
eukprot:gene15811-19318_t